jgi:hypothetical protein
MELGMLLEMSSSMTNNNYHMWKLWMNLIFERAELLDIVSSKEKTYKGTFQMSSSMILGSSTRRLPKTVSNLTYV